MKESGPGRMKDRDEEKQEKRKKERENKGLQGGEGGSGRKNNGGNRTYGEDGDSRLKTSGKNIIVLKEDMENKRGPLTTLTVSKFEPFS